jgi:hypothetical protein
MLSVFDQTPRLDTTPDESGLKSLQGALFIALAFMPGRS